MSITLTAPRRASRADASAARPRITVGRVLAWTYIAVVLFVTVFPFYWILRTALSNNYDLATNPS